MAEGQPQNRRNGTEPGQVQACGSSASTTSADILRNSETMMSEEANKPVRDKYRDLLQTVQDQTGAGSDNSITLEDLHDVVRQANEAFNDVNRPREAAIDAQILKTCGILAKINIELSQSNLSVFKHSEFARKLISFSTPEDKSQEQNQHEGLTHLVRFGQAVSGLYKTVVGVEPMYSAIEWDRPPKPPPRVKEKIKDTETAPVTKPTEVSVSRDEEEEETEVVSRMYKVLKMRYMEANNTPLCFFSFIVNPDSYSHTVDNLFNISLLVREQLAALSEDSRSLPVIMPLQPNRPQGGGTCKQCIISLSKNEWKKIVDTFDIKKTMIPPPKRSLKRK